MLGAVIGLAGIAVAYHVWVLRPGTSAARARRAARRCYELFVNKWYFDELIDALVVRPWALVRALRPADVRARRRQRARSSAARPGIVRAGSAAVRALQTGFLRAYAALLLARPRRRRPLLPAPERVTVHLSILLWLPLAAAVAGLAAAGRRRRASRRSLGVAARSSLAVVLLVALRHRRRGGLQFVTDEIWISRARHPLQARRRRAEPLPASLLTTVLFLAGIAVGRPARRGSARACSSSGSGWPRAASSARSWPRTSRCSSSSSTSCSCRSCSWPAAGATPETAIAAILKLFIYTLVGSLLMLVGGDRDRRARARRHRIDFDARPARLDRAAAARTARRSGSSCSSPRPSW